MEKTADSFPNKTFSFNIQTTWNGAAVSHDPIKVHIALDSRRDLIKIEVNGPFFNDPGCPPSSPGKPCDALWEYEVAEVFFLGKDDKYLELEFCPHGQHLVLMLDGTRNMVKDKLPLEYTATIDKSTMRWSGLAKVPLEYFPPGVCKLNAYAIHGSDENRQYEALYPATRDFDTPDFHRLQFFREFDFQAMFPRSWSQPDSPWWRKEY